MSITKTPSNTYRVEVFYPKELRALLDAKGDRYRETVKTKAETTRKEREIQRRIKEAKQKQTERPMELKGKILFKDFYANVSSRSLSHPDYSNKRQIIPATVCRAAEII